jgi:hypothetical protein
MGDPVAEYPTTPGNIYSLKRLFVVVAERRTRISKQTTLLLHILKQNEFAINQVKRQYNTQTKIIRESLQKMVRKDFDSSVIRAEKHSAYD